MYAAAAARQCEAQRQAKKKQAQEQAKVKLNQKLAKDKSIAQVRGIVTPTKSKQFHQLPANYLRTPQAQGRKFSGTYTQSKLLLPTSDQSAQLSSPFHHQNVPRSPTGHRDLRLDVCQKLTKSATATFPLAFQYHDSSPPRTPTICYSKGEAYKASHQNLLTTTHHHPAAHFQVGDNFIITPATPLPSPSANNKEQVKEPESIPDDQFDEQSDSFPLERKCSVYRNRKLYANEENYYKSMTINTTDVDECNLQQQHYYPGLPNGGHHHHHQHHPHWVDDYCDSEHRTLGICTCEHIECAQGRAAWLESGRRCSVQDASQASYHRRWVKRNRIQDSSLGGSSDDEDILGVIRGPSTFANAFLYIGLGTASIGMVIAFVGTGEKGFKTNELRLIGPALIVIGLVFCILRIFFCICPSHCISKEERNKKSAKVDADHRTSLLRGDSTKRVSIARGPYINSKIPLSSSQSSQFPPKSIVKNKSYEGVEALRQIATTSLFLENEQKTNNNNNLTVPIINEPENSEPPMELRKINTLKVDTLNVIDIVSITDEDTEREIHQIDINQEIKIPKIEPSPLFRDELDDGYNNVANGEPYGQTNNKLHRQRTSVNQSKQKDVDTLLMETSLMIIDPVPPFSPPPISPDEAETPYHPYSPNRVKTTVPSNMSLTLPLTSTTTSSNKFLNDYDHQQSQSQSQTNQPTESEIVLSPAKLGQT